MNVIAAYLLPELNDRYGNLNVIKKCNMYFAITCEMVTFKDALNYTSPVTLATYLKQWGVKETKSIFPYSLFTSVEEIRSTVDFPPYEAFFSSLKNCNIHFDDYKKGCLEYNRRKNLSVGDSDKVYNMCDWLCIYNCLDVSPLIQAISNSFTTFHQIFNVDPSSCLSLPSLAQKVMFQTYSKKAPLSYSFAQKVDHVRKVFRANIVGGIVNIFSRYTDVRPNPPNDAPHNALYAPDGNRFTKIIFLDFNSLYLTVQQNNFPTSPGINVNFIQFYINNIY